MFPMLKKEPLMWVEFCEAIPNASVAMIGVQVTTEPFWVEGALTSMDEGHPDIVG